MTGKLIAAAILGAALAAWVGQGAAAQGPSEGTEMVGPNPLGHSAGGLGFVVRKTAGEWRLLKPGVAFDGETPADSRPNVDPLPLDFGTLSGTADAAATPTPRPARRDWAWTTIEAAPGVQVHVTRLSPAVIVETSGRSVTFFAGKGAPRPLGMATARGIFEAATLGAEAFPDPGPAWLLVWFGAAARFQSTRFPIATAPTAHTPGMRAAVDCPILLVFPRPPEHVRSGEGGLEVRFDRLAGRVAMLPLYGDLYPRVQDTASWLPAPAPAGETGRAALPSDVTAACEWWAEHLAEIPVTALETYGWDRATDTITIETKVEFLRLREGGRRFAPLPPMMALARAHGFPVEVSGPVVRTSVLTGIGPYEGVAGTDRYTYHIRGLSKYVRERRVLESAAREPPELRAALAAEVRRLCEAGHLAPWYPAINIYSAGYKGYLMSMGHLCWANSAETARLVSDLIPLLDPAPAEQARTYAAGELQAYPPLSVLVQPAGEGARRERWRFDVVPKAYDTRSTIFQQMDEWVRKGNFYVRNRVVPPQVLYELGAWWHATGTKVTSEEWEGAFETLQPWLRRGDWASLGWFSWPGRMTMFGERYGLGGEVDANRWFAGLVGALRMAAAAGDRERSVLLWGQFAKAAALRYAIGHYVDYLYANRFILVPTDARFSEAEWESYCGKPRPGVKLYGRADWMPKYWVAATGRLSTYEWTGPQHDVRTVVILNEQGAVLDEVFSWYIGLGLVPYYGVVPELARFLADTEKVRAATYVARVAEHMPDWHLAYSTANIGAEHNYAIPEDSYHAFLVRAWILGESADSLRGYVDVSWMARGDLYYIHKLAETIAAYRGWRWQ